MSQVRDQAGLLLLEGSPIMCVCVLFFSGGTTIWLVFKGKPKGNQSFVGVHQKKTVSLQKQTKRAMVKSHLRLGWYGSLRTKWVTIKTRVQKTRVSFRVS